MTFKKLKTTEEQKRLYLELIDRFRSERKYLAATNPSPFTPNNLICEILANEPRIQNIDNILIVYTLEFAVELWSRGRKNITITTDKFCKLTKYITNQLGYTYYTMEELLNINKKFCVILTNPPYLNGLFRTIMEQNLKHLLNDGGIMVQLSPEERDPLNRKNKKTIPLMKEYGLQKVENHADDFDEMTGIPPIVAYYFDTSKTYNPDALINPSVNDTISSILYKIKNKAEIYGTLTQRTIGSPPSKGNSTKVMGLHTVSKDGPVWKELLLSDARYIDDASDYFFTNWWFGAHDVDYAYKGPAGPLYIHKRNVNGIGNTSQYTEEEFNYIYNQKEIKIILQYISRNNGSILGHAYRMLPAIPPSTADLTEFFEYTDEELEYISNEIK